MTFKIHVGAQVYIWPQVKVCITAIKGDLIKIQWFDSKDHLQEKWVHETKILGLAT